MTTLWRATAFGTFADLATATETLDAVGLAMSWSLFDDSDPARLDMYFDIKPDPVGLRDVLALSAVPDLIPVPDEDWVRLSLEGLQPVAAGRFKLFGAHNADGLSLEPGEIGLEIEAGPAFGTGHHGTTRGCLMAFDALLSAGVRPDTVFDLGCGTAALAIAAAKTLPDAHILASDIDPEAVSESQANCEKNGTPDIECFVADGLDHAKLAGREFDLVFANILAGPLVSLAEGIATLLAPGGRVILSGLLTEQESWVREAYEKAGLSVARQTPIEGWETLVASRP
ncbi:50S ribosomal protein L11 methyltransferase [Maricaulis sp. D1M11]|uniref:50S ribosomal protein L11 methyltransferase n=1 Tax=Maricaulis sp. D1M11 TaxID=3076117 RepID=UPI0039B691FA